MHFSFSPHILDNQFILTCAELYDKNSTLFFFCSWFSEDNFGEAPTTSGFQ